MRGSLQNSGIPSFGHFLEYLRLNKFGVGVEHYARVQYVLERLNEEFVLTDPESRGRLKSYLSPLLARSEQEQRTFSKLFDDYVEHCRRTLHGPEGSRLSEPVTGREKTGGADAAANEGRALSARHASVEWRTRAARWLRRNSFAAVALGCAAAAVAFYLLVTRPPNPQQTVAPVPAATPTLPPVELEPPPLFYVAVAVVLLLLPLLYVLLRRALRRLDPRSYENKRPPFKWSLRVTPRPVVLFDSEKFRRAARLLRRRQVDEFFRLDLGATVLATVRSLDYPSFCYKPATRVPAYLVLVERASVRDHQARLFDELVTALRRNGVILTRYFYTDDPLVCYDESNADCVRLEQLRQRHADDRLLLLGEGGQLLNPLTGRMSPRASALLHWHHRAVITPEMKWGWREQELSDKFAVVRADADGLLALAEQLESPEARSLARQHHADQHPLPPVSEAASVLDALRAYLGPQLYQWLCVCAVYPELSWETTLLVGSLPSMPKNLVNEENLLRLSHLSWFRKGSIPDEARNRLIDELEPTRAGQARETLAGALQASTPPEDTFAFDLHRLELSLQRWLLRKDRGTLNDLQNALKRLPSREVSSNEVMARFLKTVPHRVFGHRLPRVLYRRGIPALGLSRLAYALLSLALAVTALAILRMQSEDVPQWAYAPFTSVAFGPTASPTPSQPTPNPVPTPLTTPGAGVYNTSTPIQGPFPRPTQGAVATPVPTESPSPQVSPTVLSQTPTPTTPPSPTPVPSVGPTPSGTTDERRDADNQNRGSDLPARPTPPPPDKRIRNPIRGRGCPSTTTTSQLGDRKPYSCYLSGEDENYCYYDCYLMTPDP
jgi:hypothetical protein